MLEIQVFFLSLYKRVSMNVRLFLVLSIFILLGFNIQAQTPTNPLIDSHCHVKGCADEGLGVTLESYFTENKDLNIKYVFGINIAYQGNISQTKIQNDSLYAMSIRDSRLIPVYSVHPYDGEDAVDELERISELGAKFIKLHPITQQFAILDSRTIEFARLIGEKNITILIDGYGFVTPNYVEELLTLVLVLNKTRFIIAHMGGSDFHKFAPLYFVKKTNPGIFENLWVDISATVNIYEDSPFQEQLLWTMRQFGIDRILLGSDTPMKTFKEALDALYKLGVSKEEEEAITYKNALNLIESY